MKKIIFLICLVTFSLSFFAKEYSFNNAEKLFPGSEKILIDDQTGVIKYIKLKNSQRVSVEKNVIWLNTLLNISNAEKFILYKKESDKLGFTHYRYKQFIHGIPVEDGVFYIHTKNGFIVSANGEYYPNIKLQSKSVSLSVAQAIVIAKNSIKGNNGKWNDNVVSPPVKVVVYDGNGSYMLAYKTDVYSRVPLVRKFVYVNASTGNIIKEKDRIHDVDAVGTAVTKYNGTKPITTDSFGGSYRLRESGRGNGINTYDLNTSTNYGSAVDFTDADNYWNTTANQDDAAYDAHFGSEATYDYYLNNYGLNSYDNAGATINSYVHYSNGFVNAFWDGTQMTYGDGDGTNYTALTSIDVVGHEITHAVTENSAALVYSYESGALNESFSDIFGVAIDYYKNPGTANYLMGDQFAITGVPFRSMSNPNLYGDPDTYNGTNWYTGTGDNGGVHTNSGVQNFWFYLLDNGGTGTNDIGNTYSVTGIGITSAGAIAYRNLTTYLTTNSQYTDARFYAIQSAIDLYGSCSTEEISTTNAWYAVGVGAVYSNAVISAFNADITYSCTTPSTVTFTNNSINGTTYLWDFGDGNTSTATNPSHTYTSTGNYTVTLITTGSATCGTTDTLIQSNYITVTNTGGPIAASCSPITTGAGLYGMGIFNFSFSSINNSTNGGTDGYKDYTCSNTTTVTEGNLYNLTITTGAGYNEDARVWIDLNNDGQFNMANELVFVSDNVLQNHVGVIVIPGGAVYNTPLRLRVASDIGTNNFVSSCVNVTYGQYEDYSITILQNTSPPTVDFVANNTTVNVGQTVNFTDLTLNVPTSWNWTFSGATPSSSTQQNPSVTYGTIGTYPVTLSASNSFGADSLTKTAYINVVNQFIMCTQTSSASTNGVLYDSGGPTGNYSNSENCSFLINPGCATSITLTFNSFNLESGYDSFRAYDGTNTSGTLLMSSSGTGIPSPVTATSGSMYIVFTSDGSVTRAGWEATWSSIFPSSPPVANFAISDTTPPISIAVQFTDSTTNLPNSWLWDFGDGNTSTQQNPSHSYLSSGNYTVTLISNNCYAADTISYSVSVQGPPIINVAPTSVNATVACGDSITLPFAIYNTGSGDLVYNIDGSGNQSGGTIEVLALTYGVDMVTEYPNTITAINQYFTNYNLTQINTTSATTLQTALIGKDVFLIPEQESGLSSVFTGFATVLQNFVNNGGSVVFCGSGTGYSPAIFNTGLFSGSLVNTIFSGVLNLVNPSHALANSVTAPVNASNATFIYNITNGDATNIVEYNGDAVVTTRDIGLGKAILVGYDYYNTNTNSSHLIANAIGFAGQGSLSNWLTPSLYTDTVIPTDTSIIYLTFNAANLFAGTYYDTLVINSNDLTNTPLLVPVTFTVTGQPLINVSPASFNFGTLQVGASATDTLYIDNNGCDTLTISSFLPTNISFTVNSSGMQIPPYSSDTVLITFSPDTIKTYADTIFINNNDTMAFVLVNGVGVGAPIISYNPTSIVDTMFSCNDSITIPVTVYNTGQGTLYTSIALAGLSSGGGSFFYDGFESGNLSTWSNLGGSYTKQISSVNPATGSYCLEFINGVSGHLDGISNTFTNSQPTEISFRINSLSSSQYGSFIVIGDNPINSTSNCLLFLDPSTNGQFYVNTGYFSSYTANHWYYFELKNIDWIAKNFDLYIDGVLISSSLPFRDVGTSQINTVHLYTWSNTNSCYYDDIQIGSTVIPQWISSSTDTLNVNIADSSTFYVTLYSAGLNSGTYTTDIILASNDPLSPFDTIPVTFVVDGSPIITLFDTCLHFDTIMENTSTYDTLSIYNTGCDTLFITNITSGLSEYSTDTINLVILPGDSGSVIVTFSPTSIGTFNSYLTIFNNDVDTTICLTGAATGAPIISTNPTFITDTIYGCNDSITIPVTVYNIGQGILDFNIFNGGGYSPIGTPEVLIIRNNLAWGYNVNVPILQSMGANITIITSSQISSTIFNNYNMIVIESQQSLSFYTTYVTYINKFNTYLLNGGRIHFNTATYSSSRIANMELPGGGLKIGPNIDTDNNNFALIPSHPFHNNCTGVYVGTSCSHEYFTNIPVGSSILVENESALPTVVDVSYGNGRMIATGMTSEHMYQYSYNCLNLIENSFNYLLSSSSGVNWMSISPDSGSVTAGDSTIIYVTLNSTGLNSGTYTTNIIVASNDPLNPFDTIPVSFTVIGTPEIALSDTCLNFGSIMENTSSYDTLSLFNNGCDTLFVTNITSGIAEYSPDTINLVILPGDSGSVTVTFSPTSIGTFNSYLTIFNNDGDTTICLTGAATGAPIISTNPTSFNVNLSACQDSITLPFTIYNTGGSNLELNIAGSGSGGGTIEVLALTYGVDMVTEYPNTITAINQYFTNYNLTQINTTSATLLQTALIGKDVFLIPEQESGLSSVFSGFATVLQNFANSGGAVVFCGSGTGYSPAIFNTGLFSGSLVNTISSGVLNLVNSGHALANSITTPVNASNATFSYNITNVNATNILEYNNNAVVTTRNVGSGKAILVGFDYYNTNTNSSKFIANAIAWGGNGSLASWLSLSQHTDTILPADSTIIYVTFYSAGLNGGTYYTDITINSNDPINPQILIPCTLNISFDPCADFTYTIPNACSGQVDFTDVTLNSPISWSWTFGDGNTSTSQNPSHIYASSGNYVVQLVACNATSCDTASYTVNITGTGGPVAALCTPVTTNASTYLMGIYNVSFSTINNTTSAGGTDGYQDYTCTTAATVTEGNTYAINITTGSGFNEDVRVWIDYDNNGQFNMTSELVFISDNVLQNHAGNVVIPTGTILGTPLRMRVASDYATNTIANSCTDVMFGQYEDYTIIIQSNNQPPISNYNYTVLSQCQGIVQFTDISTNYPTSWVWDFGDGNTSTLQHPFHTYLNAGIYTVILTVTNAFGSDVYTQIITINSLNASIDIFSPIVLNQPIQFSANSVGAIAWQWDFGDGYSATIQSPLHTYTITGQYIVTLIATNGSGCTSTVYDTLNIFPSSINEYDTYFMIFPNPNKGTLQIINKTNQNIVEINIINALGKLVFSYKNKNNYFKSQKVRINDVSTGVYFVKVRYDNNKIITRKFLIRR